MKYRWHLAPEQALAAAAWAARLGISNLLAQCLLNRGVADEGRARLFLEPRLKQLADPVLLPDMDRAVARLVRARESGETLVVFGDYDVDGVTSAVILLEGLRGLGWRVECYLPHRLEEGYGLSREAVLNCRQKFATRLLLAVDCGSTATAVITELLAEGVEVIVLDHHQIAQPPPPAAALVNPRAAGAGAAFTELSAAGLAFKLIHAVVKHGRAAGWPAAAAWDVRGALDLAALGTVADLVPLTGENRILVTAGLERLAVTTRAGLRALLAVADVAPPIGVYEVGFQLAPRLNAAGRLETATAALDLLLAAGPAAAGPVAAQLDAWNRERQRIERAIADEVMVVVRAKFDPARDWVIVEGSPDWHVGVVGIVASRVLQEFHRPALIIGREGAEWRGSGRSIPGFDLAAGLRACGDLLTRHGGHALAAGLSMVEDHVAELRGRLNGLARTALPNAADWQPELRLDAVADLRELDLARVVELDRLQPTGPGNPPPHLLVRGVTQARPLLRMGAEKQHVKLWVTDGAVTHEAVWWRAGGAEALPVGRFDLACAPQINDYNNRQTVQLKVLDWRPAE